MIRHKLFSKGESIHALISSTSHPNILFPVKGIIYDIKFDEYNPQYQIKITKMYDDIAFIKRFLIKGRTIRNFDGKDTRYKLNRSGFKTIEEFVEKVYNGDNWEIYLTVVDSIYCCKTRKEQIEFFNKIQTFLIQKHLKELYDMSIRKEYRSGRFYFHTITEFKKSLQKFFGDRAPKEDSWYRDFLHNPSASDLDKHV